MILIILPFLLTTIYGQDVDSIQLPSQMRLDKTCLNLAKKMNRSTEELTSRFNTIINHLIKKMGQHCEQKYPELNLYMQQWKTTLPKTLLACGGKQLQKISETNDILFCASHPTTKECSTKPNKVVGTAFQSIKSLYENYEKSDADRLAQGLLPDKSLREQKRPIIALSESTISQLLIGGHDEDVAASLFHEILHFTEANNRHDHNQIESLTFDRADMKPKKDQKTSLCDKNITSDRINLLTSLCTDTPLEGAEQMKAPEAMALVQSQCGKKRSCLDIFSSFEDAEDGFNRPLEIKKADSFCSRMLFEGTCQNYFADEDYHQVFTSIQPLKEHAEKIVKKLEQFLPMNPVEMPLALLQQLPENKNNSLAEEMKQDPCLKEILPYSTNGWHLSPYYKNKYTIGTKNYANKLQAWEESIRPNKLNAIFDYALTAMSDHPHCTLKDVKKWSEKFAPLKAKAANFFQAPLIKDVLRRVYSKRVENNYRPLFDQSDQGKQNTFWKNVLGDKLILPYLQAREKGHPLSPQFDCLHSSIAHHMSFATYQEFMGHFLKMNQLPKCP